MLPTQAQAGVSFWDKDFRSLGLLSHASASALLGEKTPPTTLSTHAVPVQIIPTGTLSLPLSVSRKALPAGPGDCTNAGPSSWVSWRRRSASRCLGFSACLSSWRGTLHVAGKCAARLPSAWLPDSSDDQFQEKRSFLLQVSGSQTH